MLKLVLISTLCLSKSIMLCEHFPPVNLLVVMWKLMLWLHVWLQFSRLPYLLRTALRTASGLRATYIV